MISGFSSNACWLFGTPMVDRELMLRKLADLEEYVRQVSEFQAVTVEEYRRDWKVQRIVERTLQMAIEVCLDIANHVIADRRLRVPGTYAEVFEVLGDADLLPADLRDTMVRMAGFRNLIVHEYAPIDPALVVAILRDHLGDFTQFSAAVLACI